MSGDSATNGNNQDFSAHRLLDAFQSSIIYDDNQVAVDVRLKEYVAAYEEILKFFNYLGTVFYFAEVDIRDKLVLLNGYLAKNDENYTTILKTATHEKEKELYKVKGGNASRHILRLHRALEFIYKFLEQLFTSDHSAKSSTICSEIYHKTLGKYHTWLIRQAVGLVSKRRVVVTGVGLLSPLGLNAVENWQNLLNGKSAISALTAEEYKDLPCRIAGKIDIGVLNEKILTNKMINKADLKNMSQANAYALVAASEALQNANWLPKSEAESFRSGVSIATGMSGVPEIAEAALALSKGGKGYRGISPYFVPKILPNLSAGLISIKYKLRGPSTSATTACAAAAHAISDAFNFIRHGVADVMLCGGTESCIHPISIAGFCRMRALATNFNGNPEKASRPFDKNRDGFVMSEGAGCLLLEDLDHVKKRNAESSILAEIIGVGSTADANHITNPNTDGDGAYRCMIKALEDANIEPTSVNYINAHSTSTPNGDLAEMAAIKRLFSKNTNNLYISSFKSSLGHLLGAAGAAETVLTILACKNHTIPASVNLDEVDPALELDEIPNFHLNLKEKLVFDQNSSFIAIKNSFGFGGTNGSLCIRNYIP